MFIAKSDEFFWACAGKRDKNLSGDGERNKIKWIIFIYLYKCLKVENLIKGYEWKKISGQGSISKIRNSDW
ncbi:MAG: hypothetical protein AABX11_02635 [Nanoarchaeota archaeon]